MTTRCSVVLFMLAPLAFGGCFLERAPILPARDAAQPELDSGTHDAQVVDAHMELDAQVEVDAHVERDASPPVDACTPSAEVCDGLDNDCDPATADGQDDPMLATSCDDPADADACAEGTWECAGGVLQCSGDDGDMPDEVEVCDGADNDCDPTTPDGQDDAMRGVSCDDPADADACAEGVWECVASSMQCTGDDGDMPDEVELCDGRDNDCDPGTVDGSADGRVGARCDGSSDSDMCIEGNQMCMGGALVCDDATDSTVDDECDGVDDDCDGTIDSDAVCPCTFATFSDHSYLFCGSSSDDDDWSSVRSRCPTGYDLVSIGSMGEQDFVETTALSIAMEDFWIGGHDGNGDGRFAWLDGTRVPGPGAPGYENWGDGLPNGNGRCIEIDGDASTGAAGTWNDAECDQSQRYICESAAARSTP